MKGTNFKDESGGVPRAAAFKSQQEIADELGVHRDSVKAIKSGDRGMSVAVALMTAVAGARAPGTHPGSRSDRTGERLGSE